MERGCFNCTHKDDNAWQFRCVKCASDNYFLWMEKKQTNADRIRQMSDEELGYFLALECPPGVICKNAWEDASEDVVLCFDCWLEWLKQEAESDE